MIDVLLPYVIAIISEPLCGRDVTQVHHLEGIHRPPLCSSFRSSIRRVSFPSTTRVSPARVTDESLMSACERKRERERRDLLIND